MYYALQKQTAVLVYFSMMFMLFVKFAFALFSILKAG